MTVKELKDFLAHDDWFDERKCVVRLAKPSMGSIASVEVESVWHGFDWDRALIIETKIPIVEKHENQSVFESAYDLLMFIATKSVKKESYEIRTAREILDRYKVNYKEFANLYHKPIE